jgi:hypothetical protein
LEFIVKYKGSWRVQSSCHFQFCQRRSLVGWCAADCSPEPLVEQVENPGLEKRIANLWRRKKITKKARAGRGQESKWEIPGSHPTTAPVL